MQVARARVVQRLARNYATASETAGIKVAAFDSNQPTSSVTVFVKAGSRFEPKAGVANALKNFAFKSTKNRSAMGTVRQTELYGGVLSSSLGREHLALTAEFLRQDAPFFVDVLTSFITSAKLTRHEFDEYVTPLVEADTQTALHNPATQALEAAHALAFRHGLGQSLFAPAHNSLSVDDIRSFATSAFAKNNLAVLGTGIDQAMLNSLVEAGLDGASASPSITTPPSKYFGGETRLESGSGPQTVFIGYGIAGAPSPSTSVLASYLSPIPSVKWSKGLSPLSSLPEGSSAQVVHLPYSDATLFGLLIQGSTAAAVKEASNVAVAALKSTAKSLKPEELTSAVAKAKFAAANAVESREGLANGFASALLAGSDFSFANTISSLDKVSSSDVTKTAATLIGSKPTYVVVGECRSLPFADELGL
jgi:ubiquinol-cytochrome c reductase core subunit 2